MLMDPDDDDNDHGGQSNDDDDDDDSIFSQKCLLFYVPMSSNLFIIEIINITEKFLNIIAKNKKF